MKSGLNVAPAAVVVGSVALLAIAVIVSAFELRYALSTGDSRASAVWARQLFAFSSLLTITLFLLFGGQVGAFAYAARARRNASQVAIVVTGRGSASLVPADGAAGPVRGFFSRCLTADAAGLQLWRPFGRPSQVRWEDISRVAVGTNVEIDGAHPVIQIDRIGRPGTIRLTPQAGSRLGFGAVNIDQLESDLRKLRELGRRA
jgi:hypothetical protein